VDPDVARLVREERLLDAAQLAADRGDARTASALYERACDWARAAVEALRAGDPLRALDLASQTDDEALCERVLPMVAADATGVESLVVRLERRGRSHLAARLLESAGRRNDAAAAWLRAGHAARAAELLEASGDAAGAVRALEAGLKRNGQDWPTAVALGALLIRLGKNESAARVLQRVPDGAPERRAALAALARALGRMGLASAARDADEELAALGGPGQGQPPLEAQAGEQGRVRLFGRYEVIRETASSPSARVLECFDLAAGERVAVKLFAAWDARGSGRDALARFEREARTMRALDHPNVVPLREVVSEGPALVLAWMDGGTLERLLSTTGRLAPARAIEIATSLLSALGDAHRLGIVHRDVKPSNVLFDDAGGARLTDFGVAHLGDLSTTATAGVFGTMAYMSPEQREGRPATPRSDLFSVGVMLREMLTGARPDLAQTPRGSPSHFHRELSATHDAIVDRMTAPDPAGRPRDAFEARRELAALTWPGTIDAHAIASSPRSEGRSSSRPTTSRLQPSPDGQLVDGWTGRTIERVPLSDATLARARAFALADHPALQGVLRVALEDEALWLGAVGAEPLQRELTDAERERLGDAVRALHAAGGVHGSIDREHVAGAGDAILLRFGAPPFGAPSPADDDLALARL
jgi:serine/threonine-protein kinase